jgi:hypothetical protein
MAQVKTQLASLIIQLLELKKGKERREKLWCITCRTKHHNKEECPTFAQYFSIGAMKPLLGGGYYEICKKWGHHPHDSPLLQKYQSTPQNLFCNFCKSVGNEEKDFCAFNTIIEHTSYMYRI